MRPHVASSPKHHAHCWVWNGRRGQNRTQGFHQFLRTAYLLFRFLLYSNLCAVFWNVDCPLPPTAPLQHQTILGLVPCSLLLTPCSDPSSLVFAISCIPKQIPRTGIPLSMTAWSNISRIPEAFSFSMALPKCPTPGKISFAARAISFGSDVITATAPTWSKLRFTECKFPIP